MYSQSYGFSNSPIHLWELYHNEGWAAKNRCFWTVVLEKTLGRPLNSKETKPVNPKGNQPWIFIGSTDAEAEAPVLWLPESKKSQLIGKDPDAGKDWGQEEKGTTEDEMVGWHHWLNGCEFEQTPGDDEEYSLITNSSHIEQTTSCLFFFFLFKFLLNFYLWYIPLRMIRKNTWKPTDGLETLLTNELAPWLLICICLLLKYTSPQAEQRQPVLYCETDSSGEFFISSHTGGKIHASGLISITLALNTCCSNTETHLIFLKQLNMH